MKIINNKTDYLKILFNTDKFIIVDFFATWCNPCNKLTPILESLSKKFTDIIFIKIDIDNNDCSEISDLYNIESLPTLLFIKDKKSIDELKICGLNSNLLENNLIKCNNIYNENNISNENETTY
tara:strand:- start:2362 stop:2733 length:372 start_codon:yes stop_codon:yes gene_type:complete